MFKFKRYIFLSSICLIFAGNVFAENISSSDLCHHNDYNYGGELDNNTSSQISFSGSDMDPSLVKICNPSTNISANSKGTWEYAFNYNEVCGYNKKVLVSLYYTVQGHGSCTLRATFHCVSSGTFSDDHVLPAKFSVSCDDVASHVHDVNGQGILRYKIGS